MKQRAISAVFFVLLMLAGIFGGYIPFLILFGAITIGAGWELMRMVMGADADHRQVRQVIGALIAVLPFVINGLYYWNTGSSFLTNDTTPWLLTTVLVFPFYLLWMVELGLASERPFTNIGHYMLALVYIGIPFALLIDIAFSSDQYTPLRVFGLIGLNWLNDTFAYLTGSFIGKTPFFSRISPKKTWEGTLGGVFFTVAITALIAGYLPAYTHAEWIVLAGCVAVFGTLGDLIESMLKRSVGVKDSGNIMPGHGGFLDRFDSFVFLIPFVWLVLKLL